MCLLSAHTSFAEDFAKHDELLNFSNTVISPGTLKNITLEIAQGANDPASFIPVTVVHGAKPGPVLAVVAGVHGYEYTSIIAVNKWIAALNPRQMSGSVIIVRVAHVPAFEERSIYVNPYDRKNLNRSFPGKKHGSQTERIAWAISKNVVAKADFLIDLHSGDGGEWLSAFVGVYGGPLASNYPLALSVAKGFNFPNIVRYKMNTQQQIDTKRSLNRQGVAEKIPTILVEIGENGSTATQHINAMYTGLNNSLSILGVTKSIAAPSRENVDYFEGTRSVPVTHSGLWFPKGLGGQYIKKGDVLGVLKDYFGQTLGNVIAPSDGFALYGLKGPAIKKGQSIMTIAQPVSTLQ
ncbi:M14 family metallopeptidase [Cognaticolwellia aestuarii]|uniref:M14 family metallopeptidase n=1 Tax=Cognaticolwellia aestuarii TaxID=329993 RepID=UPI000984E861|nr:M14 family metallopeptidase [Cognaticolwellia aestuarii]